MHKDAFDLWWEWAEKPVDSMLTIDARDPRCEYGAAAGRTARSRQGQQGRAREPQTWRNAFF